ncbi:BQ5605_C008g05060 [Microbotryum silenes-dioicae]|uniref:BQ5605_C008g05060 protein n=1 Tax=Microbotryum silenes-dioicae TaxID=796604 RepID=A0A2X0MG55_9BASI|nr:BQ5605_C008g05060 [Microbotryum silenes-dioicae]
MTSISSYGGGIVLPPGADTADWVHARFERAVDIVQSLPRTGPIQTNYDDKLLLYSVYKQATEGDIKVPRPGILDVLGKAKWDAWNKKKGLSPEEAERLYVQGLLKILKGYSDRPQAIELIRELETFSLDPRGMVMSGSIVQSTGSSSSTSTEGEDPRHRRQPQASSSRRRAAPAPTPQSIRGRAPPQPSSHRHHAGPPPPASITSASVAPSLPGYGPPRTRADSPRRPEDLSDEEDYSSSSDEGRRPRQYYDQPPASSRGGSVLGVPAGYQRAPLTPQQYAGSSHGGLQPASNMMQPPQRMLSPGLAPSPQFHTPAQQLPHPHMFSPQHPPPSASMLHGAAGIARPGAASPGPSKGGSQQLAMAYPPGVQMQMHMRPPSTQSTVNTVVAAAARLPTAVAAAAAAPAGLDAALDRIQTSLTALHERLAELERSSTSSSTSTATDLDSPISLLRLTFLRLLVLLKIRSPTSQRTLPKLSWYGLFVRLVQSLMKVGRRVMGDLGIAVLLVAVLGRVTGRGFVQADGIGESVARVVRALGGVKRTREARLEN